MAQLTSVSFPARWFDVEGGDYRVATTKFALGPGPCGKVVTELATHTDGNLLVIHQVCSDASIQQFTYKMSDILGRIHTEVAP